MADYLSSGGIKSPDILSEGPRRSSPPPRPSKDELYLEGYGRAFGEKMTYSVGLTYGLGILSGGTYGFFMGLRQGGATSKLLVNSVLNSCSRYGPALGNQSAIITMYYVTFMNLIGWIRGTDDVGNSTAAGVLGGALYKVSARGWQPKAKYAGAAGTLFTALDLGMRQGYF
eukprot:TRINITY_DN678_c0_g1_i1.p2 TRINITY_DN678_c0_g1~~TRINITY_DN678_c0_g1_i1.p2  ORF type:complete len:171 (+),score=29.20 TRINITY_DN678_c0_g1_i1:88-600(+)